jgi:hypothetical protein
MAYIYTKARDFRPAPGVNEGPWRYMAGGPKEDIDCKVCGGKIDKRTKSHYILTYSTDPEWDGALIHPQCGRVIAQKNHGMDFTH